ncbi:GIN domain-containing protein [Sphingomonas sp. MMS24-JH45]
MDTPELAATLVGKGRMALAGKAARARLTLNGEGMLDAAAVVADEVDASLVGTELRGAGRYAARIVARGEGRVLVTGTTPCSVRSAGGATVSCGRSR